MRRREKRGSPSSEGTDARPGLTNEQMQHRPVLDASKMRLFAGLREGVGD